VDIHNNLMHCVGYNVLAYDPKVTYTPWVGNDMDGNKFTDQSPTKAMVNPYTGDGGGVSCDKIVSNSNGGVCNLETGFRTGKGAFYYVWNDRDSDGEYDKGECSSKANSSDDYTPSERIYISGLTNDADKVNYANWFSYYRTRDYVMKRAVSQIIAESRDRLGLAVINNLTGTESDNTWKVDNYHITKEKHFVGTPVKDVDDLTLPLDKTAQTNKATLMDNLLGVKPNSWTPLRLALKRAGDYFSNQDDGSLFGYNLSDATNSAAGHSPILSSTMGGTCQQNFVVLLSDGFWNGETSPAVGNADGDDADNAFDGQSYADTESNTLADVAMNLYKGDLLTTLDNKVPAVAIPRGSDPNVKCFDAGTGKKTQECFDTNDAQHLVTFTVSFGLTGILPKTDGSGNDCIPPNRTDSLAEQNWPSSCDASLSNSWPKPVENTATTVDDMMHAAWNGRGLYLSADNPAQLISKLNQAISNISARKPVSAAAVAVDTFNFVDGGKVFQGRFNSADWTGQLTAKSLTDQGFSEASWEAHTLLDNMDIASRILVTYNGTKGVTFAFPANYKDLGKSDISQAHINDLLHDAPYPIAATDSDQVAANKAYGESLVAYLRGDGDNEGTNVTNFRERNGQRLGDIVHSSPVYVGDPDPELYPDSIATSSYQDWANNTTSDDTKPGAKGRQAMLYVGANDGALHAFNADTGAEVFAYYPQAVFSAEDRLGLHWLADPTYEHRYYLDIEPAVGEVYSDTGDGAGRSWRTLMVGGLRGGGRSMYAIDVSKPSEFTDATGVAANILWEFTHPDLGYTYSKPTIVKLNDDRWAAIFGNGYNQTGASATGKAALFIKYLDNNATTPYRVIYTDVGTIASGDCQNASSNCNGLSTPAVVDLGADRVADRVYAGDLHGNLWVFDLSDTDATKWGVANGTAANPEPLMTAYYPAEGGDKLPQPITTQPIVTLHPTERHDATRPNTMVFFGTGQYMTENDPVTTGKNSFYGIWDSGAPIAFNRAIDNVLVEQSLTVTEVSDEDVRLLSNNPVNYDDHKGWFIDLPTTGERVVVSPIVFGDLVVYTTFVPFSNLCSDAAGYSWLMMHNLADGTEPDYIALDVTGDGVYDEKDQSGEHNVAGIKSDTIYWQPTLVEAADGFGKLILPTDDADGDGVEVKDLAPPNLRGTRSSWGIFRHDD
jgi:type IV pilus assembly protein PilY1